MERGEALGTAAQGAVALAGFAGVVVVFRSGSVHEWSPIDKLRLRLLLSNSILPSYYVWIGLLLLTSRPAPAVTCRWCSGFAFVMFLLFAVTITNVFRRLDLPQIPREHATRFVFYLFGSAGSQRRCCNCTTSPSSVRSGRSSPESSSNFSPPCSSLCESFFYRRNSIRAIQTSARSVMEAVFTGRRKPRHIRYRELQIPLVRCREGGRNPR